MTGNMLQFSQDTRPLDADVRVFESATRTLRGSEFTFRIIGSSHAVSAPAHDFYELASCEPVEGGEAVTIPLDAATDGGARTARRLVHETPTLRCTTTIERRPLTTLDVDADLRYRFAPDAVTAISISESGYETYHTYPEFDLLVYSQSAFEWLDESVSD